MHLIRVSTNSGNGTAGARITNRGIGSIIGTVTCTVVTSATSEVRIDDSTDGLSPFTLLPNNAPVGVHVIPINAQSRVGDWWISTGAGTAAFVTTPTPANPGP